MLRIKLEILKAVNPKMDSTTPIWVAYDYKVWLLELIEDDAGIYRLYRHYGYSCKDKLTKKLDLSTEHLDIALVAFESKLKKKLDKKEFRFLRNGEGLNSPAILRVFRPKTTARKLVAVKPAPQTEHRKLQL